MDIETLEYEPIKLEGKSEKSKLKLEEVRVPARLRERLPLEKPLGSVKVVGGEQPARVSWEAVADADRREEAALGVQARKTTRIMKRRCRIIHFLVGSG